MTLSPSKSNQSTHNSAAIFDVNKSTLTILNGRNQPLTATLYTPMPSSTIAVEAATDVEIDISANVSSLEKNTDTIVEVDVDDITKVSEAIKSAAAAMLAVTDAANTVQHAVMLAPATGIKRQFYNSFATYLCAQGFGVITFDNEGIGDSLTCPLAKCDASLISWGRHDLTAVLDALQNEFTNANYHLVGHSAGGQLIGLMPNYQSLSSVVNVACSSGRIKNMPLPFKAQAMFFMDAAIPLSNLLLGYTPSDKFGMGEPLPSGVAQQWRDWCNGKGYVKTAFNKTIYTHFYDEIATPSLWLNFSDDDIANAKNVEDMLRVFTKLPAEKRMLVPADFGLKYIGHMTYFSQKTYAKAPELWQMASDWIAAHSSDTSK